MAGPNQSSAPTLTAPGARILVAEARFYDAIADDLLRGALAVITAAGAEATVVTVPGALELAPAIAIACDATAARGAPFDAAVALGCVIRGETGHYDIVAGESARALMDVSIALRLPLGNGVLTVETHDQARARARVDEMDKGGGAARAALTVLALKQSMGSWR